MSGALLTQVAGSVPFDNSNNGFVSDNVQSAIEEVKADALSKHNFSYFVVGPLETITIPSGQEMIVDDVVEVYGELDVLGIVLVLQIAPELPQFSYSTVLPEAEITIPEEQEMVATDLVQVLGVLEILGVASVLNFAEPDFPPNFSFEFLDGSAVIAIPSAQEMILSDMLVVEGMLLVEGTLTVLAPADNICPPELIESGDIFQVPRTRQLFLSDMLVVEGELILEGTLAIAA